jgi:hypothetical protein
MDPSVMEAFAHIPERTRYIFRTIGIEESYWPQYLKKSDQHSAFSSQLFTEGSGKTGKR